ncbi:MAG: hypothetical protein DI585_03485 [Pseudomonas fluorescens]|nr:MAG: hypothetical protein DI585_03485 [Pseudomonas fluorescens]
MAIMPPLTANPTLSDLQAWTVAMKAANNWTPTDFRHELALLVEEVGELAKAHRKISSHGHLTESQRTESSDSVGEEMADVLIYLCSLANVSGVNLEAALRAKLEKNQNREWTKNAS